MRRFVSNVLGIVMFFVLLAAMVVITVPENVCAVDPDRWVDDDAVPSWYDSTHHKSITAALTAASPGDWIYVIQVHILRYL